jgi:hypothetical protein
MGVVLAFTNTIFCAACRLSLLRSDVYTRPNADQLRSAAVVVACMLNLHNPQVCPCWDQLPL